MHSAARLVAERLPQVREHVARLFGARASPALRDEYVALRLRLEGELLRYLMEHPDA
jgi:hypothetical protein